MQPCRHDYDYCDITDTRRFPSLGRPLVLCIREIAAGREPWFRTDRRSPEFRARLEAAWNEFDLLHTLCMPGRDFSSNLYGCGRAVADIHCLLFTPSPYYHFGPADEPFWKPVAEDVENIGCRLAFELRHNARIFRDAGKLEEAAEDARKHATGGYAMYQCECGTRDRYNTERIENWYGDTGFDHWRSIVMRKARNRREAAQESE